MTVPQATSHEDSRSPEQKQADKEQNFRMLEAKYQRQVNEERNARLETERRFLELQQQQQRAPVEEDDDDEPYIDKKKLEKKLARFGQENQRQTQSEIQKAVELAIKEERRTAWLKNNKDFDEVMSHAEKLAILDPELAEDILEMPNNFERQKIVYKNIKNMGLHKPEERKSIQETVDSRKKGIFYHPSGFSNPAAQTGGDFSAHGQKQAFEKMQALKANLRLG